MYMYVFLSINTIYTYIHTESYSVYCVCEKQGNTICCRIVANSIARVLPRFVLHARPTPFALGLLNTAFRLGSSFAVSPGVVVVVQF